MMRITGFLAGVGLTIAAFLLVLDIQEDPQPETFTATTGNPTAEELSAIVDAIAEQVDVVPAEAEPEVPVPPNPESVTAAAEPQSGFMEAAVDDTLEEPAEASAALVAAADVVQPGQESGVPAPPDPVVATVDDQLQNGFEASSMELAHLPINQSGNGTYLFWSPFRSTWAAQGFAGRLTLATQVPVDVINTGPGKYRVAFSFRNETERLARIEHIETITGLKLE
ncbi:hypothetical protein ACFL3A_11510 [Pseudomonadota bacterium]